jgi:hypothetical protein
MLNLVGALNLHGHAAIEFIAMCFAEVRGRDVRLAAHSLFLFRQEK